MTPRGFPPLASPRARLLVLGSLPGAESLRRQQYYAQPRNGFWTILGALVGAGPWLAYDARVAQLVASDVALWDVCASARRHGSLDAAIERTSVEPNAFATFFGSHPAIRTVCFNGRVAASLYRRRVLPTLAPAARALPLIELPSTSPAHAAMPLEEKIRRWRVAFAGALGEVPAYDPAQADPPRSPPCP